MFGTPWPGFSGDVIRKNQEQIIRHLPHDSYLLLENTEDKQSLHSGKSKASLALLSIILNRN